MANHDLRLAFKVNGKLPGGRVEREYVIAQSATVIVDEVSEYDLYDGAVIRFGSEFLRLNYYDGRYFIKDSVDSSLAAHFRAQAFMISDYHVAKNLLNGSTFDVLFHDDAKLLQRDLPSAIPEDLRQSKYHQVFSDAYYRLLNNAHKKLIDCEGVLYLDVGIPVTCLRFIAGTLQVFIAFKNETLQKSDVPVIFLPVMHQFDPHNTELNMLIEAYEELTKKKAKILSEADFSVPIPMDFDYSARNSIETEAIRLVADKTDIDLWKADQAADWTRLRDALKSYKGKNDNDGLSAMSDALVSYAKHLNNEDFSTYVRLLHELWVHECKKNEHDDTKLDISLDGLDLSNVPRIDIDDDTLNDMERFASGQKPNP